MFNCLNMSSDVVRAYDLASTEDRDISPNDSSIYNMINNATGVKNTEEKRHSQTSYLLNDDKGDSHASRGLVKSLLIGAAVLTGIGALAAGGYYYMAGRANSGRSELALSARLLAPVVDNIPLAGVDHLMDIDHSSLATEATSSPYSYYESIYGSTSALNNNRSTTPPITTTEKPLTTTDFIVTTTEKPITTTVVPVTTTIEPVTTTAVPATTTVEPITTTAVPVTTTTAITTTEAFLTTITKKPETTIIPVITSKNFDPIATASPRPTSEYMTIKPTEFSPTQTQAAVTEYKHEAERNIFFQSVQGKYNYPFGTKFFNELLKFCLTETKYDIEMAYQGNQDIRCKRLDDINDKIADLKEYEALVRRINADKETLSVKEHGEEIMLRRKLATLYLAAEAIIDKKDFATFLNEVNRDYKRHPTAELKQREENIFDYFSEHC